MSNVHFYGCADAVESISEQLSHDGTRIDYAWRPGVPDAGLLILAAVDACFIHADRIEIHEHETIKCERCLERRRAEGASIVRGLLMCADCVAEVQGFQAYKHEQARAWRDAQREDEANV